jgi:pullulanase
MWDKLLACLPGADDSLRMKYHRLATSTVLLSQGIPFLHSGQEFFRTKKGDGNSYRSPDEINHLDWERKIIYKENVNFIKGIIQIRKTYPCFRMKTSAEIRANIRQLPSAAPVLGYLYNTVDEVILLINPSSKNQAILIPEGDWVVLADHVQAGISSGKDLSGGEVIMEPVSINVLLKK